MNEVFSGIERKKVVLLGVIGALGLLFVILGCIAPWEKNKESEKEIAVSFQTMEYIKEIENKIRSITEKITGSTDVSVMVSTESGTEFVYVSNEDINGDDTSKEYITVKNPSGEYELVLSKEVYPSITGVSIVCPGGDDYAIQVKLINSVSTAFGLSKNRICVVGTK